MPNLKLFVDERIHDAKKDALRAMLPTLRSAVCEQLSVQVSACQLAVIPVMGLDEQPLANLELQYLAKPDRTPDMIRAACTVFSGLVQDALGSVPAVRATPLDPVTYVALK